MAMRESMEKISWMFPLSHFDPSETKISSALMEHPRAWYSFSAMASRRKG